MHEPMMNVCIELKEPVQGEENPQRILCELPYSEAVSRLGKELGRFCQVAIGFLSWKKQVD